MRLSKWELCLIYVERIEQDETIKIEVIKYCSSETIVPLLFRSFANLSEKKYLLISLKSIYKFCDIGNTMGVKTRFPRYTIKIKLGKLPCGFGSCLRPFPLKTRKCKTELFMCVKIKK